MLHTYSVDYVDNQKYFKESVFQPNSDKKYIDRMVEDIGSIHHEIIIDHTELAEALHDAAIARDLPGMGDVDSSLLLFCKEVKKILRLLFLENVQTKYLADIPGIIIEIYYLKTIFHGLVLLK